VSLCSSAAYDYVPSAILTFLSYSSTSLTNSTATSSAAVSLATDLSKLTDLAMSASATASGSSSGQGPDKAIDGCVFFPIPASVLSADVLTCSYVDGYKESGLGSPYEVSFSLLRTNEAID
jgi:hypothetical protein